MNALHKALAEFRECAPLHGSISNVCKHFLMECGVTAGEIDRCLKAVPVQGVKKIQKSLDGRSGYYSLVKTCVSKGYSKDKVMELLCLTSEEFEDFLRN